MKRNEIEQQYKWNTDLIFASKEAFDEAYNEAKKRIEQLKQRREQMLESAASFYETLELYTHAEMLVSKLYTYAHLSYDADTADNYFLALSGKCEALYRSLGEAAYFVAPQIIALQEKKLEEWYRAFPKLEEYRRNIELERRYREHSLDEQGEKLLAQMNLCLGSHETIRDVFSYADLRFGMIRDENGDETALNDTNYIPFMMSRDRRVRKEAFETLYATYAQFSNSYAALLNGFVKEKTTIAKIRNFPSSLQASVFSDEVNETIYNNLISSVNANMQVIYDYYALKKKTLGIGELHMYDIYAPLVSQINEKYSYEQAVDIVLEALKTLGADYVHTLEDGIRKHRWIDVYPTNNKKGGAYSSGCYGTQPYILLNFTNTLSDISTLAHEAGHSMHSYYSWKNNTPQQASYTIFVAEVASTVNELLLAHKLIRNSESIVQKKYVLNQLMETYKGTLFRQCMFAEFEKEIHAASEAGEILTAELLSEKYYALNQKYFGNEVCVDNEIRFEWERIPHFYYNFYVYKYATCISAASAIVKRIESEGERYVKQYIDFLCCGGSKSPLESLRVAGIDMTSPEVIQAAIDDFSAVIKEFDALENHAK